MIEIKTFSFTYNHICDRIQFIANAEIINQRIDFWITRRMTRILIKITNKILKDSNPLITHPYQESRQAIHSFEFQCSQQSIKKQQKTITLIDKKPILLVKVDIKTYDNHFEWLYYSPDEEPIAFSSLTRIQMHAINGLINDQILHADWDLTDSPLRADESIKMQ